MRLITINMIYLVLLLSFTFNSGFTYIANINVIEVVYTNDRKVNYRLKKIKKLKNKFFNSFFARKKHFLSFIKKIKIYKNHKKINDMVNLE